MERIALFPGSFHPFTKGHEDIVRRGLLLFDKVIIALGQNSDKGNHSSEDIEQIRSIYANNPRVSVVAYDCLSADLLKKENATCILRGIRNEADLAYEQQLAQVNYTFFGVETVFLLASPHLKEVSSSIVRELKKYGKDVSDFLPNSNL